MLCPTLTCQIADVRKSMSCFRVLSGFKPIASLICSKECRSFLHFSCSLHSSSSKFLKATIRVESSCRHHSRRRSDGSVKSGRKDADLRSALHVRVESDEESKLGQTSDLKKLLPPMSQTQGSCPLPKVFTWCQKRSSESSSLMALSESYSIFVIKSDTNS